MTIGFKLIDCDDIIDRIKSSARKIPYYGVTFRSRRVSGVAVAYVWDTHAHANMCAMPCVCMPIVARVCTNLVVPLKKTWAISRASSASLSASPNIPAMVVVFLYNRCHIAKEYHSRRVVIDWRYR